MTWTTLHHRGEILRAVAAAAAERGDGLLPMDVPGVRETFGDELSLLAALQLRWHTRLSGHIERELMDLPMDLESGVVAAWQATVDELPGVRLVLDSHRAEPLDEAMAEVVEKSVAKERILLAMMAGHSRAPGDAAVRAGAEIERRARESHRPSTPQAHRAPTAGLLDRIKAVVAA